jgi:hypothetical protein
MLPDKPSAKPGPSQLPSGFLSKGKQEAGPRRAVESRTQVLPVKALQSAATQNASRILHGSAPKPNHTPGENAMANYGKYRGTVVNNSDPSNLGRIMALVPAISETPLNWALPNAPFAGRGVGFFARPPKGANVWIEFEGGDPNYPVWTGGFWGEGETPSAPGDAIVLIKEGNSSITISGRMVNINKGKASIVLSRDTVNINDGALEVT